MTAVALADLEALATHLRAELATKKFILLYAHNGTGKTRLSGAFRDLGREVNEAGETTKRDTLYFNAYTEDLFTWDNDLQGERQRVLELNSESKFFDGLRELEMEVKVGKLLQRYTDLNFYIDYDRQESEDRRARPLPPAVTFFRERTTDGDPIPIKISRGEENIFKWCFFLATVQLAIDDDGNGPYNWVKFIYIDDPISSLDENNAIAVANHLAQMLSTVTNKLKTVVSTHHTLFFNVICNELKRAKRCYLSPNNQADGYIVRDTGDTPFFQHVATLAALYEAAQSDKLYTHHFNMLRSVLEKTASFHGYQNFSACIKQDENDEDGVLYTRLVNILSHGNYSLFEPQEMLEENKAYFRRILNDFIRRYPFNAALFPQIAAPIAVLAPAPQEAQTS